MGALLKFMLIVFVIYYILKIIVRIFLPSIVKGLINNMANKFEGMNEYTEQTKKRKAEGEITIDYIPKKEKGNTRNNNEDYVEYEEIR